MKRQQLSGVTEFSEEITGLGPRDPHFISLDILTDATYIVDSNLLIISYNKKFRLWCEDLALDTEVIGHALFEALPFLQEKARSEYRQSFITGETVITEEAIKWGGKEYFVEVQKIPVDGKDSVSQVITIVRDISVRKQSEKDLRARWRKYRELVENANSIMLRMDPAGTITFINLFAQRFFGCGESELLGRNVIETIWPGYESPEGIPDLHMNSISENVCSSGDHVWIAWTQRPMYDEAGRVREIICIGNDITEQKRAEEAFRKGEQPFRAIFESINEAVFIHDVETGAILDFNSTRVYGIYGYTREEVLHSDPMALSMGDPPYSKNDALGWLHRAATEGPQLFEWQTRHKTGHLLWVEVSIRRAMISDKDFLVATVRDITGRKKAEEVLKRLERSYHGLFETIPDGFAYVTLDGMIAKTNGALQGMLGYTAEELQTLTYSDITPAKWHDIEDKLIKEQVLKRGYSDVYEKEYIRKDGTVFPIEIRSYLAKDDAGNPMYMWGFVRDISERKKAEKAIHESEEKFRLLFEKSSDPILLLDGYTYVDCNDAAVKLMHCSSKKQLVGMRPFDLSPEKQPDGRLSSEKAIDVIDTALREGVNRFEWIHRTLEGEELLLDVSLTVIPIHGKGIMYTVWRDITAHREAEMALRQTEEKYRTIYQNSIEGIFQTTPDGRCLSANPALARMLGYGSPEDMVSHVTDIGRQMYVNPEERERFLRLYQEHDYYQGFETEFYKQGGSKVWVFINGRAVKSADDNVLYYEGTMQDITERKKAEERLYREREIFSSILHNAPYGIFLYDPDGRFLFLNPAAINITGYTREDMPDRSMWFAKAYPARDYRKANNDPSKSDVSTKSIDRTLSVRCKDGTQKEIEFRSFKLPDGKSVAMFQDITQRQRADDELRKSREELRNLAAHIQSVREEERTRIAREIHDELGQALTCVKIDLSEITEQFALIPSHRDEVLSKMQNLLSLVDGTIDAVRRIAADLRPSILDDFGLPAAVEWLLQHFRKRTGILYTLKTRGSMIIDKDTATAAFRIIQESLTNVARHSGADRVTIALRKRKEEIMLKIEDGGRGIKESELASPTSFGILGIKERVSLLGGTTIITGKSGKGTTVTVRIPLTKNGVQIRKEEMKRS